MSQKSFKTLHPVILWDSMEFNTTNPQRIMVVDDERDILEIIYRALQKYGLRVDAYSDPRKAIQSFKAAPNSYALVITDIRMPGINGLELAEQVWAIREETKILFMTAYLAEEINIQRRTMHKRDIIEKPFTIKTICDQVKLRLPPTR